VNKIGITCSYWITDWEVDLSKYIAKAAGLGFDILEVDINMLDGLQEKEKGELKTLAEKEKIILSFTAGLTNETDISSVDKDKQENGIAYLRNAVKTVHEFGGNKLSGVIYAPWGLSDINIEEKKSHLELSIKNMKEIIKTAEKYDVICNVEVVNRFEQFLLNTCEEAINYVKQVDSSNIKILLDTYHMNIEEDNIKEAIVKAGEKLGHLHIGENNRKLPGQGGHICWDDVIQGINEIEYNGFLVMEPFIQPGGEIGRAVKVWRDLSQGRDLDELARESLGFIKGKL